MWSTGMGKETSKMKILAIVAHPDDEYGCAGFLLRAKSIGYEVHLLCATKGEAGKIRNKKKDLLAVKSVAEIRTEEFVASCNVLGVDSYSFLGLIDGQSESWDYEKAQENLKDKVESLKPTHILIFDANGINGHPDHIAVSKMVKRLINDIPDLGVICLTKYPKEFIHKKFWFVPSKLRNKIVKSACLKDHIPATVHTLTNREWQRKMKLLKVYNSQLTDEKKYYYSQPKLLVKKMSKYETYILNAIE